MLLRFFRSLKRKLTPCCLNFQWLLIRPSRDIDMSTIPLRYLTLSEQLYFSDMQVEPNIISCVGTPFHCRIVNFYVPLSIWINSVLN